MVPWLVQIVVPWPMHKFVSIVTWCSSFSYGLQLCFGSIPVFQVLYVVVLLWLPFAGNNFLIILWILLELQVLDNVRKMCDLNKVSCKVRYQKIFFYNATILLSYSLNVLLFHFIWGNGSHLGRVGYAFVQFGPQDCAWSWCFVWYKW